MKIYFDMDGTLADLYGVDDWRAKLIMGNNSPYLEAKPMVNMSLLARHLNRLRKSGYQIGIVTWLSMSSTPQYDKAVREAKKIWLAKHLPSVVFDEIHMVQYGRNKNDIVQDNGGILFDDDERNRSKWKGKSYDETQIIEVLKGLF